MSADNGIYILETYQNSEKIGAFQVRCKPYLVYRVAATQAFDNLDWYENEETYNVGCYLASVFGKSKVYLTEASALEEAARLHSKEDYVEYGIRFVRRPQYHYYEK